MAFIPMISPIISHHHYPSNLETAFWWNLIGCELGLLRKKVLEVQRSVVIEEFKQKTGI